MSQFRQYAFLSCAVIILLTALCGCSRPDAPGRAGDIRTEMKRILKEDTAAYIASLLNRLDTADLSTDGGLTRFYETCNSIVYEKHLHGDNASSLRIMRRQLEILKRDGQLNTTDTRQLVNIYISLGAVLIEQGMPGISLDYYMAGLECCSDSTFDTPRARLYNNIGIVYAEGNMLDKAESYFKRSLQINLRNGNHYNAAINYRNLTQLYTITGKYDAAMKAAQSSLDHIDGDRHPDQLAAIRLQQGILYTNMRQYDLAMQRFAAALAQYRELKNTPGVVDTYRQMSQAYLDRHLPDSAMAVAEHALRLACDTRRDEDRMSLLLTLSKAHEAKGDYMQANRLRAMSMDLEDSIHNEENRLRLSNWDKLSSDFLEHPASGTEESRFGAMDISLSAALVLALTLAAILLRRQRRHAPAVPLPPVHDDCSRLLDQRNRELTMLSLERIRVHEDTASLCDDLRVVLSEINPKDSAKRSRIRGILSRLEALENQNADEEFRQCFERVHPRFYLTLSDRYPDLTPRDQRLCAFLYMGLTTKEMAAITSREVRSVESARNRLRKKLGLDISDDLTLFLRSLTPESPDGYPTLP